MIKVADMGYQFVNVGGYEANRPNGSGDFLFLYLRCPTEVFMEGEYRWLPAETYFGTSVNKDITHAKIEQASHLLHHTNYSIGKIANLCGYENAEHFSRIFKKYTGKSPRAYRKDVEA